MKNQRIQKFLKSDIDNMLYWISIFTISITAILYITQLWISRRIGRPDMMECKLKSMLGIPCPGCGGTRALIHLLKGDLFAAVYYHAFAVYSFFVYGAFFMTQTLQRITGNRIHGMKYRPIYLKIGIIILLIQYAAKLIIPGYII